MADNSSDNPATEGNQTITGSGASDQLSGGFGNDTITGGTGDDVLRGDGPISGFWHFETFDYNFSSAAGQAFDFGDDSSERTGSGYVTDFNEGQLTNSVRGTTGNPSDFGVIYTSTLEVSAGGTYTFATRSDDGSTVQIFDSLGNPVEFTQGGSTADFMNNDFHQGPTTRSGEVTLDSNETYTIQVRYWENGGGDFLAVTVDGPDTGGVTTNINDSGMIGVPPGPGYSTTGESAGVEGDDIIDGGNGDDDIDGEGGNDTLSGGADDDTIAGGIGDDIITGGTGDDVIFGDESDDPGAGNEYFYAGNAYIVGENYNVTGTGDFGFGDVSEMEFTTDPVAVRFLDNDQTLSGDFGAPSNDVSTDATQSIEINGVEYDAYIDFTQTFEDSGGTVYTFAVVDVDLNDSDTGANDANLEDGYVLIQIGGPSIPPGTTLTALGGPTGITPFDYDTLIAGLSFDDTVDGGDGNDTIQGGRGEDAITVGVGDTATGGDDADTFTLDFGQTSSDGSTVITIDGSTGETDGADDDRLDLTGLSAFTLTTTADADGDSVSGTAVFDTGQTVNFSEIEDLVVCFAKGTQITTEHGTRAIETLDVGDKLATRDNGLQAIRWIGERILDAEMLAAFPKLRPIRIEAGALGEGIPSRDLIVSPQHRILVRSKIAVRMFDAEEILVPAKHLLGLPGVATAADVTEVVYFHLLCDNHEIIEADGALAETLYTGAEAMKAMTPDAAEEIALIFGDTPFMNRPLARFVPQGRRASKLVERHVKNNRALYG